jgi:hypothetical protein
MGALTTALAGCTGDDNQENDDPLDDSPANTSSDSSSDNESSTGDASTDTDSFNPASELAYAKWLTADEDQVLFAHANIEETPESTQDTPSDPPVDDPLLLYPVSINSVIVGPGQLSLLFAGLAQAINPDTSSDSTVSELTVVNNTVIAEGTFATDQLDERLAEPADETFGVAHEQTGTVGGYDQYEPVEVPDSIQNAPAVGVTDETVIVSQDADRLEQTIAAGNGDEPRIFETDETVAELLELAGTGDRVVGQLGVPYEQLTGLGENQSIEPNPQFEPRSSEDVVASISFEMDGNSLNSAFALTAPEIDADRQETIESSFGTAAVDGSRSVTVSDNLITASGTYDVEQLTASQADQSLSQTAATELVSPDSLTFQYEPPQGQAVNGELWVNVTEDTDAAAIRVEADSGGSTEFQPQDRPVGADDSVAAQVDPDGDAVTVFAVNNEGAAGELLTQPVPTDELSETAASEAVPEEALSFSYDSPESGNLGGLTVEVVANTEAETLVAQPQAAPSAFTGRIGSLGGEPIDAGTTVETAVEPDGDEVIIYATVDAATGEVARWQGPD